MCLFFLGGGHLIGRVGRGTVMSAKASCGEVENPANIRLL
jgi:hypothetical protein